MLILTKNNHKIAYVKSTLGTFPKALSQLATSHGYFPKWQLPKCAISQSATSQALGPQPILAASTRPPLKPAAPNLMGSCRFGNCTFGKLPRTWENTLGKLPLGKNPLEKYLTP